MLLIWGEIADMSYSINDWKKSKIDEIVSSPLSYINSARLKFLKNYVKFIYLTWSILIMLNDALIANGIKLMSSFYFKA